VLPLSSTSSCGRAHALARLFPPGNARAYMRAGVLRSDRTTKRERSCALAAIELLAADPGPVAKREVAPGAFGGRASARLRALVGRAPGPDTAPRYVAGRGLSLIVRSCRLEPPRGAFGPLQVLRRLIMLAHPVAPPRRGLR
jgi:hypothetical protein